MLFFIRTTKLIDMIPIHVFWPIIDCFSTTKMTYLSPKHIFDPLPTVLASMLLELNTFKVLFYGESVGVVACGHVTKMAVTPFDPQ